MINYATPCGIGARMAKRLAVIAVLGTALVLSATVPGAEKASALDGEEDAFLGLINNYRAQNGLAPLSVDPALNNVARWMANDMAAYNYFGLYRFAGS